MTNASSTKGCVLCERHDNLQLKQFYCKALCFMPYKHLNAATLGLLRRECFSALWTKNWHFHNHDINRATRGCNWDKAKNSRSLHFAFYFLKLAHCYISCDENGAWSQHSFFSEQRLFFLASYPLKLNMKFNFLQSTGWLAISVFSLDKPLSCN